MHSIIVGKREFIHHTSKYLRLAGQGKEVIVTHQNKPTFHLSAIKKKTVKNLQGLITEVKINGDINDSILISPILSH